MVSEYRISVRRACRVVMLARSTFRYQPAEDANGALRARIREIAMVRVRYGLWRVYTLLRREGWMVNHKRVYRLYKEEGLNLRSKRPRRSRAAAHRLPRVVVGRPHESWSMDFVADALFDGRRFRALTVFDNFSRKCLAIFADQSIKGAHVTDIVSQLSGEAGGPPERIQVDNGSEFISKALDRWAYENDVTLDFSRPGKPTESPRVNLGISRSHCFVG